jgi:hypothetical protein
MDRVLESHRFGPHRVDIVEFPDDESSGLVVVVVDGVVVTEPPLDSVPSMDEVMRIYARWRSAQPSAG